MVAEISASSNEQAQGISQVNNALGQMDQVTQQNTANAEEIAAASQELAGQANALLGMISQFTIKEETGAKALGGQTMPAGAIPAASAIGNPIAHTSVDPSDVISLDDGDFGKY